MVALIAAEAERSGIPLTEEERQTLLGGWYPETIVPDDFRTKAKKLIEQTFTYEPDPDSPISLGHSVMWAGEDGYPMIVALTEEVMREKCERSPLRGRRKIIDRLQLIGSGLVVVILMMLIVVLFSWLFGGK
jgi:hypothetical protein